MSAIITHAVIHVLVSTDGIADQDFPDRGYQLQSGVSTYYSTKFCLKTAQKLEVNFAKRWVQAMLNIYSLHSLYKQIDPLWIFNL